MGMGATVRHRLGRFEIPAAEAYRAATLNLDDLAATIASLGPATRILEIGCGEGAMADRLTRVFPAAQFLGIDPIAEPGRLFRGDRSRATFRRMLSSELLTQCPDPFDLVVIVDVLHHIPDEHRRGLLSDAAALTTPGGLVAVLDWERGRTLSDAFCYLACRWVANDPNTRFMTGEEFRDLVRTGLPEFELAVATRVPPRRNNLLIGMRSPVQQHEATPRNGRSHAVAGTAHQRAVSSDLP